MKAIKIQKYEDVGINSARDLTKEELLECIGYTIECDSSAKFWFEHGILHIADKRRRKKLDDEKTKGEKWIDLQKKYADLLKPYKGKTIDELPQDVIEKGAALERQIRKAKEDYFATFG